MEALESAQDDITGQRKEMRNSGLKGMRARPFRVHTLHASAQSYFIVYTCGHVYTCVCVCKGDVCTCIRTYTHIQPFSLYLCEERGTVVQLHLPDLAHGSRRDGDAGPPGRTQTRAVWRIQCQAVRRPGTIPTTVTSHRCCEPRQNPKRAFQPPYSTHLPKAHRDGVIKPMARDIHSLVTHAHRLRVSPCPLCPSDRCI